MAAEQRGERPHQQQHAQRRRRRAPAPVDRLVVQRLQRVGAAVRRQLRPARGALDLQRQAGERGVQQHLPARHTGRRDAVPEARGCPRQRAVAREKRGGGGHVGEVPAEDLEDEFECRL